MTCPESITRDESHVWKAIFRHDPARALARPEVVRQLDEHANGCIDCREVLTPTLSILLNLAIRESQGSVYPE